MVSKIALISDFIINVKQRIIGGRNWPSYASSKIQPKQRLTAGALKAKMNRVDKLINDFTRDNPLDLDYLEAAKLHRKKAKFGNIQKFFTSLITSLLFIKTNTKI